jgi:geranylgeranyl pyrophosphate synthase
MTLLGKPTISLEEISQAIEMYKKYGSLDHAKKTADRYIEDGLRSLEKLPKCNARQMLETLARFLVQRQF